jgi:hydroxyethylthiazole kinase
MRSDLKIEPEDVWADIQSIRSTSPLIHNITNYVAMEHTANSLLALGASPVMAHALEEVEEMSQLSSSLVINIGTLSPSWIKGMQIALSSAKRRGLPVVLDPAGAGATSYRTDTAHTLLAQGGISVIRGNASEIVSLDHGNKSPTKGVEGDIAAIESLEQAKAVALKNNCVVWMSGHTDLITDGKLVLLMGDEHLLRGKVAGMGSVSSAITGAFLAVNDNPLMAAANAAAVMGVAAELAGETVKGPGAFKMAFLDVLYTLSKKDVSTWMKKRIK